jgi:hypothetical protein
MPECLLVHAAVPFNTAPEPWGVTGILFLASADCAL